MLRVRKVRGFLNLCATSCVCLNIICIILSFHLNERFVFRSVRNSYVKADKHINADFAVVFTSDSSYLKCVVQLLRSLREPAIGNWKYNIIWITGKGYTPDSQILQTYNALHHISRSYEDGLGQFFVAQKWRGGVSAYYRFEIFMDEFFRTFESVIYFDVDGHVTSPVLPIIDALRASNVTLLMRDNGIGIGKGSLFHGEYFTPPPGINDTFSPGASCLMAINMTKLPRISDVEDRFYRASRTLENNTKYADQGVLNFIFRSDFAAFSACSSRPRFVFPDEHVQRGWASCAGGNQIYVHDFRKKCLKD